ncbi:MAG: hypothetical protein EA352_01880 [Gemmatimonadales bacterium]|nr:MAG: hypothetical protein EA352_01880 [Gemmatimonadales bacterium]
MRDCPERFGSDVAGRLPLPGILVAVLLLLAGGAHDLQGQVDWRDFVVTSGLSAEGYQGNLPTVAAAVQDSTEAATAMVGELAMRGDAVWRRNGQTRGLLAFDGGVRQFNTWGFELDNYAPTEWAGTLDLAWRQPVSEGLTVVVSSRVRGREVRDRPPMPLFLAPAYASYSATAGAEWRTSRGFWDLRVRGERSDYFAPEFAPQVSLLDREGISAEVGHERRLGSVSRIRVFGEWESSHYPEQNTFAEDDPFRRDRTIRTGAEWRWQGDIIGSLGAVGRFNRSNSRRPEYNSITVDGSLSTVLPGTSVLTAYAALTLKSYRESTPFARLIPGEEANSASTAYVALSRGLVRNIDSTVRLSWTRAETEIGGDYFQRFGAAVILHYRPGS